MFHCLKQFWLDLVLLDYNPSQIFILTMGIFKFSRSLVTLSSLIYNIFVTNNFYSDEEIILTPHI